MTKMPPFGNERELMREDHPSRRVAEHLDKHRSRQKHSGLEAATALGVNWGTYIRMTHGCCDFGAHANAIADYTNTPVAYIRGMAMMNNVEQEELKVRLEKSLKSYREMIALGRSRRSQVRNALLQMEKEART